MNQSAHAHDEQVDSSAYEEMSAFLDHLLAGALNGQLDGKTLEKARDYSCEDADVTLQLSHLLLPRLKEDGFEDLYREVEIRLVVVLAKMERNGVKIDVDLLNDFSKEVEAQLRQKMEQIYRLAGEVFNINSSQQLGKILFEN
jgi:DNA polymerase-1